MPRHDCPCCTCPETGPISNNKIDQILTGKAPRLAEGWAAMWRILAWDDLPHYREELIQAGMSTGLARGTCENIIQDAVNHVPRVLESERIERSWLYRLVHYTLGEYHVSRRLSTGAILAIMQLTSR